MKLSRIFTSLVVIFPVSITTSFANEPVEQTMTVPESVPSVQFDQESAQASSPAVSDTVESAPAPSTTVSPMTVKAATVQSVTSAPDVHATQNRENTVFVSPRTGMRYSVSNPSNRKIIFQTEGLKPITAQNVDRIRATNPVISAQSQQQARQKLLDLAGIQPTTVQAPATVNSQMQPAVSPSSVAPTAPTASENTASPTTPSVPQSQSTSDTATTPPSVQSASQ